VPHLNDLPDNLEIIIGVSQEGGNGAPVFQERFGKFSRRRYVLIRLQRDAMA
jgi:hypothetical protein